MKDVKSTISISKVDATNFEKLDGAKLKITDTSGTELISWTTSKQQGAKVLDIPEYFLPDTEYILSEVSAPNGYKLADAITFKVGSDNVLYVKGDDGNYTSVASGEIVMKDAKETVTTTEVTTTEETTTTTEATTTEAVTTTEATTTQEMTADSITTVTEVVTTETSISTATSTTETPTTTTTSSTTETKTGDAAPIEPITVVMLVAAVGIIILGISRKKRDEN